MKANVRRIIIKQGADTVVEFPLTVGWREHSLSRSSPPQARLRR